MGVIPAAAVGCPLDALVGALASAFAVGFEAPFFGGVAARREEAAAPGAAAAFLAPFAVPAFFASNLPLGAIAGWCQVPKSFRLITVLTLVPPY